LVRTGGTGGVLIGQCPHIRVCRLHRRRSRGALSGRRGGGEAGALKVLISKDQFPSAISAIEGRHAAADLAGGPLGAFLLGISLSLPFLFNAVSFLGSLLGILAIKGKSRSSAAYQKAKV